MHGSEWGRFAAGALVAMALALAGCGGDGGDADTAAASADTGSADAGTAAADTGSSDGLAADTGAADAATADDATADAATTDAGAEDGAAVDGATSDASDDISLPDVNPLDAAIDGLADAEAADAAEDVGLAADTTDVVSGPQPCSPTLAITPQTGKTLPYDLRTFVASGGTGAYRYALVNNASGAVLNKLTGAYLSGDKSGVTDIVKVTDLGCVGDAQAKMTVVEPITMAPLEPTVAYKQAFQFKISGGSGSFAFKIKTQSSGASVQSKSGAYVAGSKNGDDQVQVLDLATGETSVALVHVRANANLVARPPRLVVPVGTTADVVIQGGSGHFTVQLPAGVFTAKGGAQVTPSKAGKVTAKVVDTFTKKSVNVQLTAVAATEELLLPTGDGYVASHARRVPDLDGDGGDELVVSIAEADVGEFNAGAVYLYRSKAGGLDPKPAQVLHGVGKDSRFGYGMRVADVDGDKRADLIVGAPYADIGTTNNGAVYVYRGLKSGVFTKTPKWVLKGPRNSDQMGWGVASCDVNGDGLMDVAAGALYAENPTAKPVVSSTGALYVWLGHADGFLEKPDLTRYGAIPDGKGKWKSVANTRIGWDVASGDVNGDGLCDLAVSSLYYKGATNNDGLVSLYLGTKHSAKGLGGPTTQPVQMWSGQLKGQSGSQFGRSLAMADIDGDGQDELVVGQLHWRGSPAKTGRGAVRVFNAPSSSTAPATKVGSATDAAWTVEGPNNYDYYGYRVSVGDATGDGVADILANHANGEVPGGPTNTGLVAVYAGKKGQLPSKTPTLTFPGLKGGDYMGLGMAALADVDGDGKPEIAAFAGLDDSAGYNLGRPYLFLSKTSTKPVPLQIPMPASGSRYAWHTSFVGDLNGDGFEDLAVGAPWDAANKAKAGDKPSYQGTRAGVVHVYKGTASGVDMKTPAWVAKGFAGHSAHDYAGWFVTGRGDFDGDGVNDLAMLARADDRPSAFSSAYVKGTKCGAARNNVSAVYVFRGTKAGWPAAQPAFVAYGPQVSQYGDSVALGMDVNGDGIGDLVVGGYTWDAPGRNNAGGWGLFLGKKAGAGVSVLCAPSTTHIAAKANDYLGRAVVPLHDIDGDGCDEFAVGADAADHGLSNQGTVHVVYGWGPKCASATPREVVLKGGASNARAGISLASGADVDGDKIPDLVVGGYAYSNGSASVGTAWVVTSGYLKSLKPIAIVAGKPPTKLWPVVDPGSKARLSVTGLTNAGQFGWSVGLVPGLEKDGRAGVLVGSPNGDVRSGALTGGAELFRWALAGAQPGLAVHPMLSVTGEGHRPGGRLGYTVAGGLPKSGKPVVVVGGYYATPSTSKQVDQGAAYVVTVPQP